jgi:DNA-binding MarR family transcriptional regulator
MMFEHLMNREVRKSRENLLAELSSAVRAQQRAVDVFDQAVVDRFGLNRTDGRVIDLIQEFGPMSAGEVARAAHLSTGAVTAAIDRLVARGLVARIDDPHDRRRVLVRMTPKAERVCAETYGPLVQDGHELLARFSDAQVAVIIEFLRLDRELHERHTAVVSDLAPVPKPRARPARRAPTL